MPNFNFHEVTPLSKYLAMALFVAMPFIGGWIGYTYAPLKVQGIENEKPLVKIEPPPLTRGAIATSTVDMGEYSLTLTTRAIEVLDPQSDGSRIRQTIPWDVSAFAGYYAYQGLVITSRDINYNHYLDVGLLSSIGYGGANQFYKFYTYNPETGSLEAMSLPDISNPAFDIQKRTITSAMRGMPTNRWHYTEYVFKGVTYVENRSWDEYSDELTSEEEQKERH